MFHYITFISFPLSFTVKNTINNTKTLRFHSKTSFLVMNSGCLMAKIHSTRTKSSRTQDVEKTWKNCLSLGPSQKIHRIACLNKEVPKMPEFWLDVCWTWKVLVGVKSLDVPTMDGLYGLRLEKNTVIICLIYFVGCNQYEIRTKPRSKVAITQKE